MDKAIDLLTKELIDKSQGQISIELGVSKTTINLLIKNKYPKPENMYKKIHEFYGNTFETFVNTFAKMCAKIYLGTLKKKKILNLLRKLL